MKQKIKSLLLALALIVSLVPTALASSYCPQGHPLASAGWQRVDSTYHTQYCYMGSHSVYEAHQFYDGVCVGCGYSNYYNQHTHTYDNNYNCTICGYNYYTGSYANHTHTYDNNYNCTICGYNYYTGSYTNHTHTYDKNYNCTVCGYNYYTGSYTNHTHTYDKNYNCTVCGYNYYTGSYTNHTHTYDGTYTCIVCGYNSITGQYNNGYYNHTHTYDSNYNCTICGYNYYTGSYTNHTHTYDSNYNCTICGYNYITGQYNNGYYNHTHTYDSNYNCTICGYNYITGQYNNGYYNHTHTYDNNYNCTICGYNYYTGQYNNGYYNHTHTYDSNYNCTICGYNYLTGQYNNHTHTYDSNYNCTICGYNYYTGQYNNGYYNHTHTYDSNYNCTICGYNYLTGQYNNHTHTYDSNYNCTICGYNYYTGYYNNAYAGISTITYSAEPGKNVKLSASDFQNFWKEYTNSNGTLKYVQITSVTGNNGTLCYKHSSSETSHSNAYGSTFYLSPTSQQKDLSKLTFVPAKSNGKYPSGTVTINFTAYGTVQNNTQTSASGTVTITFANTNVQAIDYKSTGGYVTLNSNDFIKVCQSAGSSTTNFSIKFLDVPAYGKLYSSYANSGYYGSELTQASINSLTFSATSSAANAINNVTYVPGSAGISDTVRYAAYSGSTLLYIGTVTFTAKEIVISYTGDSNGISFDYYDFYYSSNASFNLQYVSFGTPSSGTLYKNYANGKGTAVTSTDYFNHLGSTTAKAMSTLTYVPKANYTGVVEIPFTAFNLTGASFSGTVKVYVVAKPFSDVSGWSTSYINRLYAAGVVGGTSATTFSPKNNMKYGEALKMILLAAGYSKQSETGGKHWASAYLNLAYSKGIVSSTSIDLNALVDRNTVAELAAKALGLSKATSVNAGVTGPSDSTNGYVYALYNAGIVSGETVGSSNKFYGNRNITREEVAKIICNIMDYEK